MKVTIVGFENISYTDKTTGEVKEMLQFSYTKPIKKDGAFGCSVGTETVSARAFPEQYSTFMKLGDKVIGKTAIISKDIRSFKNEKYAVLDELEIL